MAKKEWIIVEGITEGGAIEYQVSKKLCNKLNKEGK